jgi:integrase
MINQAERGSRRTVATKSFRERRVASLLIAQCNHRIDAYSAPRWNHCGGNHCDQQERGAGARNAGFHTFRHSVASFVNQQTGNIKLAQLLGHSTIAVTGDVNTHLTEIEQREASSAVERAIYGNLFQTVPRIENKEQSHTVN